MDGIDSEFCADPMVDYAAEKTAMWNGNRSFAVNGSWNAIGFVKGDGLADKDTYMDYGYRPFVTDSGDVLAGFISGWMLNKELLEPGNEARLAAAVAFVNAQCDGEANYDVSICANGVVPKAVALQKNTLYRETAASLNGVDIEKQGVTFLADKISDSEVQQALYGNFGSRESDFLAFRRGDITASDFMDRVIAMFG